MADPSKTEKATPKRRRDERKRGNVVKSQDVIAVATLTIAYAMMRLLAPTFVEQTTRFIQYCLEEAMLSTMSFPALLQELLRQSGVVLVLTVAEDDTGMVIGRHGKIAKAIRQIMKAAANTCGKHVTVEIK